MHPLIDIDTLDKLTDAELLRLEAALRELVLTQDLDGADLRRCLASLSNSIFVRLRRSAPASEITLP